MKKRKDLSTDGVEVHEVGRFNRNQPEAADRMIFDQLEAFGQDLSHPRNVDHYLYFPTRDAANAIAGALQADGFNTEVRQGSPDSNDPWLVLASADCILNEHNLEHLRQRLEELAESMGGNYDGWETGFRAPETEEMDS